MIVLGENVVPEAMKPEPALAARGWLDESVAKTSVCSAPMA
jgi:hypothetical protein